MHFINVKALANDLRYGTVDERESSKYLVGTLILQALATVNNGSGPETIPAAYRWGSFLISALIIFFGVRACYRANKEGDDREFLKRFFCLALPIGLLISITLVIVSVLAGIFIYWKSMGLSIEQTKYNILIPLLFSGYCLEV